MIAADSVVKLKTVVVYLARDPGPNLAAGLMLGVNPEGLSQLIDSPEPTPSPGGLVLLSMRNQLTVTFTSNRLEFNDGSDEAPARADFPDRVARVAQYIAAQSNQSYAAVGLNFDVEAEPDDEELPRKAILDRLVKENLFSSMGYDAMGATGKLWYLARERRHELLVEPRVWPTGNQYEGRLYFAHLNVHVDLGDEIPTPEWLSQALDEEYKDFIRVLTEILKPQEGQ